MGSWEIPKHNEDITDNARGVTSPENFRQSAIKQIISRRIIKEQLPVSANSLLGLFVGDADIEKAIARGSFSEHLLINRGARITLVDIKPPTISDDLIKSFDIELIPENVFEFLARSKKKYELVTVMGADGVFNDSSVGKYRKKFLRHFLPRFVERNGLVISMFRGGNSLLGGFGWKALHGADNFAGVWRKK